jgi:hypothetical protein
MSSSKQSSWSCHLGPTPGERGSMQEQVRAVPLVGRFATMRSPSTGVLLESLVSRLSHPLSIYRSNPGVTSKALVVLINPRGTCKVSL